MVKGVKGPEPAGEGLLQNEQLGNRLYALIFVHLFSELLQLLALAEFQILDYVLKVLIFRVVQLH